MSFNFIGYLLKKFRFIEKPYFSLKVVERHPNPSELSNEYIFLVKNGKLKKMLCFLCPGKCGKKIVLPLSISVKPNWKIRTDWLGRPSIELSIRVHNDCHCHYWIRKGRVSWCMDNGLPS